MFKKLFAMTAVSLLSLASCTNELEYPGPGDRPAAELVSPVKAPEVTAWTGTRTLGASYAAMPEASVNSNFFKICDFGGGKSEWMESQYPLLYEYFDNAPQTTDRGEYVSQHEYDVVMEYLRNHPDEGSTECDLTRYFIQNVGSSNDEYTLEYLTDNGDVHHTDKVRGSDKMNYLTIDGTHIPDYNATDGKRALVIDIPVEDPTYADSYGTIEQTKTDAYRFYYIEVDGVMNCYLCFDYKTKKYDNGLCDYQGDKVFSDWVIKLVPADGSAVVPPQTDKPSQPVEPETPEESGHINHDEVEINLSVLDSHEGYDILDLVSKLSIHVRHATDVEVFIPVPAEFYCVADDLDIVLSHQKVDEIYGAESVAVYEVLPGHTVTLTVSFEENGIRITTDGIDQEVIDFCMAQYRDGINFEIWNYFNDLSGITRDELYGYLDQSTVRFLDSMPKYYINAFAEKDGEIFDGDRTVSIILEQVISFTSPETGWHLNASPYNEIFTKK